MSEHDALRRALRLEAEEAVMVDLEDRVQARAQQLRRRRRMVAGATTLGVAALAVAAGVVVPGFVGSPQTPEPVGDPGEGTVVDLGSAGAFDGRPLTLVVADTGTGSVYGVAAGGSASRLEGLPRGYPGVPPMLAPDGRLVVGGDPATHDLWVWSQHGGPRTYELAAQASFLPSVSPDGTTVALEAWRPDGAEGLFVVDLEAVETTEVALPSFRIAGDYNPVAWVDDGSRIVVTSHRSVTTVDTATWTAAPPAAIVEPLLLSAGSAVSPDGSSLLLVREGTRAGERVWWRVDTSSGDAVEAFSRPTEDRLIGWSAGDRLVWWRSPAAPEGPYQLLTSDSGGAGDRVLMRLTPPDGAGTLLASWAPGPT